MAGYPQDFPVPTDQGGPGAGQPIGGFGGNTAADRDAHRALVAGAGKAPVLLVHGNGGAADVPPWDLLDQNRMLLAAGYPAELIWAPSYLGTGEVDLFTPHTNNIDDVRDYLEAVCSYLDVQIVDVIAHSLGCTLMYSLFRGLARQASPVSFDQPKKWNRVGTFVSLAGAFHGLGTGSIGEWQTGAEFMNELLTETEGGGGETPFAEGLPQTPPVPHNITYFCGIATGDFVDAQNPGTGRLAGAINRSYNLGTGTAGHQEIKESQVVFNDYLPLLNSVPPVPAVIVALAPEPGEYPSPLAVTITVEPEDLPVSVTANRLTKKFDAGYIVDEVVETRNETVANGQAVTLETPGMWQLSATVAGLLNPVIGTYWVGVAVPSVTIVTDPDTPFDTSLLVTASTDDQTASLYYSLDGTSWNLGAAVTITDDAVVYFIAINPDGVASAVVSESFSKRVAWDDAVTANATDHFIAGRIDVTQYLAYSDQFGFFTPFTLYHVNEEWVLDPEQPTRVTPSAEQAQAYLDRASGALPLIRVSADDPQPGRQVIGPLSITIEAPGAGLDPAENPITVYYTRDGAIPTIASASFTGSAEFDIPEHGHQVIACHATDGTGNSNYQVFAYQRE